MADIYIKNIDVPSDCDECRKIIGCCDNMPDRTVWCRLAKDYIGDKNTTCPLVSVPPHGRLIDADALREDWLENGENEYVYDTNAFLDSLDTAPTIIPVSEEVK